MALARETPTDMSALRAAVGLVICLAVLVFVAAVVVGVI